MFKQLCITALIATAAAIPAHAATTFNLTGAAGTATAYSFAQGGLTLGVTAATYRVAPTALTALSQLTTGATVTRSTAGLGVKTSGEDGGETPQVDTNGATNEVLRLALGGASRLLGATFHYVDDNDSLRVYGLKDGALTLLGYPGEFWDNTASDAPMGGGVTVTHSGTGSLNNNWTFTVAFPKTTGAYDAYYFTGNADSADGYQLSSVTVAPVPEAATWGMMVLGFGGMGAAMRRPRRSLSMA